MESIIIVAMICVTLGYLAYTLSITTYKRDKLEVFSKTKYKDLENEIAITSENETKEKDTP
jgi:CBS domain containing-hemolysin-like protein